MKTTLNAIRKHSPCTSGWNTLLKGLNKTSADDEPLDLMDILKHTEIQDSIWCLRVFEYRDYCLFLADVAESVLPLFEDKCPDDKRPREAIQAVRKYHAGEINKKQLQDAAYTATLGAAYAAAYAATTHGAAHDAAYAATHGASHDAAYAATHAAAYAAYAGATYDATNAAAYDDARTQKWQEIEQLFIKHFKRHNTK